jgi:protein gp37
MRLPVWGPPSTTARKRTSVATWKSPAAWHRAALKAGVRRRLFVASLADVFEDHPDVAPWRAEALAILAQCTALDVQLLTKRPENVRRMVPETWLRAWPRHVWIGATVEDQRRAEERIPELLKVPAAVRFLSCEPLLEEVDLRVVGSDGQRGYDALDGLWRADDGTPLDRPSDGAVQWVIVGAESGPGARPMREEWVRSLRDQCAAAKVPFFYKQRLEKGRKVSLPLLDGRKHTAFPEVPRG